MTKYRIIEKVNGLGEITFHLERHGFFGWREVQYSVGVECTAPIYHKTVDLARKERDRLLENETRERLAETTITTKIVE